MPHSLLEVMMIMLALPVGPTVLVAVAFLLSIRWGLRRIGV